MVRFFFSFDFWNIKNDLRQTEVEEIYAKYLTSSLLICQGHGMQKKQDWEAAKDQRTLGR